MSRLLNPYFQLCITVVFITAGELFLSSGASTVAPSMTDWLGTASMGHRNIWFGVACLCVSAITWALVLKKMPLYLAFTLSSVVHVTVPVASWLILNDRISALRWLGIALVLAGIWIIARPTSAIEERS